jgi:hypothetical protein
METEILKINILSIAVSGLLILVSGILLFCFRAHIAGSIRFFLPIPPIGVAAYIFIFNMFKHFDGAAPGRATMLFELMTATVIASLSFLLLAGISMLLIVVGKNL